MQGIAIGAAAMALVTLAGCDQFGKSSGNVAPPATNSVAAAPAPAPATSAAPAPPAAPPAFNQAYLVGSWSRADCAHTMTFAANNQLTVINAQDQTNTGTYAMEFDGFTVIDQPPVRFIVHPVDQNNMDVTVNGTTGHMHRCQTTSTAGSPFGALSGAPSTPQPAGPQGNGGK